MDQPIGWRVEHVMSLLGYKSEQGAYNLIKKCLLSPRGKDTRGREAARFEWPPPARPEGYDL
jgi:hypothetical protein